MTANNQGGRVGSWVLTNRGIVTGDRPSVCPSARARGCDSDRGVARNRLASRVRQSGEKIEASVLDARGVRRASQ